MELAQISETVRQDAVWIVFLNVLLQQAGLPVPAVPTMLLVGSLLVAPGQFAAVLAAAVLASVVADWLWYGAGRMFGYRVLSGLCWLSINPASCVSQTEARFVRWGPGSLVIAKFIPGFSTVAPPIAGSLQMAMPGFLLAAAAGAALWAGLALGAGWLFRHEVQTIISALDAYSGNALILVAVITACWLGWKVLRKYQFRKRSAIPHIMVDELLDAMKTQRPLLLLDLRGHSMVAETGHIPGATPAEYDRLAEAIGNWPRDQPIVTLCACPEDAGAIMAALRLLELGYQSVRPLKGGYEAWLAAAKANS